MIPRDNNATFFIRLVKKNKPYMYQLYAQIIDGKTENDTLETVPTFNRKITETEATSISLTHIYMIPNTYI